MSRIALALAILVASMHLNEARAQTGKEILQGLIQGLVQSQRPTPRKKEQEALRHFNDCVANIHAGGRYRVLWPVVNDHTGRYGTNSVRAFMNRNYPTQRELDLFVQSIDERRPCEQGALERLGIPALTGFYSRGLWS